MMCSTRPALRALSALALSVCLTGAAASAATIVVNQVNLSFSPSSVNAKPGDTITWQWNTLAHTVTSGVNCVPNGTFSGTLSAASPTFSYVIPANTLGTINYYCQPHCLSNMKGTIVVSPIGDINNDGKVDGADIGLLIGAWGSSNPAADINHDGVVDGGDLGILLGNWTG